MSKDKESLVDCGIHGDLGGQDVKIICFHDPPKYLYVIGIDSHKVKDLPIVTEGEVAPSQKGPVLVILLQYVYLNFGSTLHSYIQLQSYKNKVDDKAFSFNGS